MLFGVFRDGGAPKLHRVHYSDRLIYRLILSYKRVPHESSLGHEVDSPRRNERKHPLKEPDDGERLGVGQRT